MHRGNSMGRTGLLCRDNTTQIDIVVNKETAADYESGCERASRTYTYIGLSATDVDLDTGCVG